MAMQIKKRVSVGRFSAPEVVRPFVRLQPDSRWKIPQFHRRDWKCCRACRYFGYWNKTIRFIKQYILGWGVDVANAKLIVYTCTFVINDVHACPTVFNFALVEGGSPLILVLDEKRFATQSTTIILRNYYYDGKQISVKKRLHTSRPWQTWKRAIASGARAIWEYND